MVECICVGGYGFGGVFMLIGVGMMVEEGKCKVEVDGKLYLLEMLLYVDFVLIEVFLLDYIGNLVYVLMVCNFNLVMVMVVMMVIVDVVYIVFVGMILFDYVVMLGVLVDFVIVCE